jgi:transmembrane sensor
MNSSRSQFDPAAEEQAALWAARLDGSNLSADDRAALDTWMAENPAHRTLLSAYCQFSADLEQQLPLIAGIKDPSGEIQAVAKTARSLPWLRWPVWAGAVLTAAAAVAVFFVMHPRGLRSGSVVTPAAQQQVVTLADGSVVELNARTSLQVDLGSDERHVRLADGEAFFTVSKDPSRPFIVETPAGSVRVTGTRFNVRAEESAPLEVTVLDGSVQVRPGRSAGEAAPVSLHAGDRLAAGAAVQKLSAEEMADALAWREGYIVFRGVPLHEALARFARYHGRGLVAGPGAGDLRVSSRLRLADLDGFLSTLESFLPVRATRDLSGTVRVELRNAP